MQAQDRTGQDRTGQSLAIGAEQKAGQGNGQAQDRWQNTLCGSGHRAGRRTGQDGTGQWMGKDTGLAKGSGAPRIFSRGDDNFFLIYSGQQGVNN